MEWITENGPCALCASWDRPQVDHIDPKTKTLNPTALWSLAKSNPRRIAELKKCQVLCYICHTEKARGESAVGVDSGQAKVTEDDVRLIRILYQLGFSQHKLAARFGLTQSTVGMMCRYETWRHVQ